MVRRVSQSRGRRASDGLIYVGAAAILLFAIVGVVSAGAFVANKVSSGSTTGHRKAGHVTDVSPALQDIARAQVQATAIVKTALQAGHQIVGLATQHANKQASTIVSRAERTAAAQSPTAVPQVLPPVTAPGTGNGGSTALGGATSIPLTQPTTVAPSQTRSGIPDLSGVPASWLVVGYNATFGAGPGSAGSISVINRSAKSFGGVAEVVYAGGQKASASFSDLSPGQTAVLPLSGPAYTGGGYHIVMANVR
ncbi:MAG: hypothetical protein DLM70_17805 [Chloroflexi bacterium]|nr:MAG: hypothetical protein DLM70_17805 [Chloroflexota bacterium]